MGSHLWRGHLAIRAVDGAAVDPLRRIHIAPMCCPRRRPQAYGPPLSPPPPRVRRRVVCRSQRASTRQHKKILVSGTIGAFRLEKKNRHSAPSPSLTFVVPTVHTQMVPVGGHSPPYCTRLHASSLSPQASCLVCPWGCKERPWRRGCRQKGARRASRPRLRLGQRAWPGAARLG